MLQKVPEVLSGAVEPTILPEGTVKYAHDGLHHLLDAGGKHRLQILQSDSAADALVAIVPLDQEVAIVLVDEFQQRPVQLGGEFAGPIPVVRIGHVPESAFQPTIVGGP